MPKIFVMNLCVALCLPELLDILIGLHGVWSDLGMRLGEIKLLFDPLSIKILASLPVGS